MYVGSDAIALAPITNKLTYLEEGDWAAITRSAVQVFDTCGSQLNRPFTPVAVESVKVDKSGHRHIMAKEIGEQPRVVRNALAAYINEPDGTVNLPEGVRFHDIRGVVMVACGTALYACQVARYWFGQIARMPVKIDIASAFRYRHPVLEHDCLLIVVRQSGETSDTLAALRHIAGQVRRTHAVVKLPTSLIAREVDVVMPILAGLEIEVASTKAFTVQLISLLLLACKAGLDRGKINADRVNSLMFEIQAVPGLMSRALDRAQDYARVAEKLAERDDVLFLGRGTMFPMTLEAALKLKELSYIHAEAYAAGELKHGPIALIDKRLTVVIFAHRDMIFENTTCNMQEVMARHGQVILLTDAKGAKLAGYVRNVIVMPILPDIVAPLIYKITAHMLAYNTAIARGTDLDQSRNLSNSATVE